MFTKDIIEKVWSRAIIREGFDPDVVRQDACGAWILKSQYGSRDSIFGWEIDHIFPESRGGADDLDNLRAMQWENNVSKGDDFPCYTAKIQAEGHKNIYREEQFTVNEKLQGILKKLYN